MALYKYRILFTRRSLGDRGCAVVICYSRMGRLVGVFEDVWRGNDETQLLLRPHQLWWRRDHLFESGWRLQRHVVRQ